MKKQKLKNIVVYSKDSYGIEYWNEYDENGYLIHCKNSYGYEQWYEYYEKIKTKKYRSTF